ncbi:MAG: PRC-barrel domain-containing protein [Roseicyclus sp.]
MTTRNLLLTTALAALLAAPLPAQDTGTDGAATEASGAGEFGSWRVGDLVGLPVETEDGTEVGRVEAVIEGDDAPQILVAMTDRTIALPLDAVTPTRSDMALMVDEEAADLEEMAAYEDDGEMTLDPFMTVSEAMTASESDMTETDEGTGSDVASGEGGTLTTGRPEAGDETDMAEGSQAATPPETGESDSFADMTVSDVLAMNVVDANGENMGNIEYLYRDGSGAYMAVMGIGGFLGIGEHTVTVPLGDFTVDTEQNALFLDRTEEDLEEMAETDEDTGVDRLPYDHEIDA